MRTELHELEVQRLDQRIFTALGISNRRGFSPLLIDRIVPVVSIPLVGSSDTPEQDTAAQFAFTGFAFSLAGGAGVVSHVQLFNPVDSGVEVFCQGVDMNASAVTAASLRRSSVALGALFGVQGSNNDLGNGPAPKAELRVHQQNPAQGVEFASQALAAGGNALFRPGRPWRLAPGQGFQSTANAGNTTNLTTFFWCEFVLPATA